MESPRSSLSSWKTRNAPVLFAHRTRSSPAVRGRAPHERRSPRTGTPGPDLTPAKRALPTEGFGPRRWNLVGQAGSNLTHSVKPSLTQKRVYENVIPSLQRCGVEFQLQVFQHRLPALNGGRRSTRSQSPSQLEHGLVARIPTGGINHLIKKREYRLLVVSYLSPKNRVNAGIHAGGSVAHNCSLACCSSCWRELLVITHLFLFFA